MTSTRTRSFTLLALLAFAVLLTACQPQGGDVPSEVAEEADEAEQATGAEAGTDAAAADGDCQIEGVDRSQVGGQGATLPGGH